MMCDGSCTPQCYACSLRAKGFQVSPKATPNRRNTVPPREHNNSWEKGVLRDERGMPILRDGKVIPLKQAAEQRHKIEAELRQLKQGHVPTSA